MSISEFVFGGKFKKVHVSATSEYFEWQQTRRHIIARLMNWIFNK